MSFQIIRNDITKVAADAIVNTANPKPCIGSGTDSAIYTAAGEKRLLAARKKIGEILPGQAVYTKAFRLKAKYIIHTVGPVWIDGSHNERELLRSCYHQSLLLAADLKCESIAFPLISSGTYGFPKDEALNIALSEIRQFLSNHEMKVLLVVFDSTSFELSEKLTGGIEQYIDEHAVKELQKEEYIASIAPRRRLSRSSRRISDDYDLLYGKQESIHSVNNNHVEEYGSALLMPESMQTVSDKSLDEILNETGNTFQQQLFELIDASGMDDVTVYKKANIDRKVFSRIRCKSDYKPKKKTALAFAIALELDLETTLDLLSRAEMTFSPSSRFDLIVSYFIRNGIYDIYEINAALFKYGQPILGE